MIKKTNYQAGFTIVELLIATAVLSTILVLATVVMVNIGTLYYKGINQAKVQDDARSIADEVTRNIQLNDQPPTAVFSDPHTHNTQLVCIGPVRYAYVLGVQIDHQAPPPTPVSSTIYHHVLWRDNNPTPGSCPLQLDPSDPTSPNIDLSNDNYNGKTLAAADTSGTELITDNSRLTQFSMTTGSPSFVAVGVASGDDDLLCNPGVSVSGVNSCNANANTMQSQNDYTGTILCKGGKGDQFCSTANLTTTAVNRLAGGSF